MIRPKRNVKPPDRLNCKKRFIDIEELSVIDSSLVLPSNKLIENWRKVKSLKLVIFISFKASTLVRKVSKKSDNVLREHFSRALYQ